MDGVGAVDDAQDAGPGVEVGEGEVVGDAGAAEHLDGAVDDGAGDLRCGDLDGGDVGAGAFGAVAVDEPGGLEHQQSGLFDLDAGVRDEFLDDALVGERLAEGGAVLGAVDHEGQGPFGHADGAHGVVDPAGAEAGLGDGEPVALTGEAVGDGHTDVVEGDLGVAVLVLVAEHGQVPDDGHAGGVTGDQHHGLLPVGGGVGVGLAHDDEDLAAFVGGSGDPPLVAVDDVVVAVAPDAGLEVGGVGARDVGLGHRERRPDPCIEQRFEPLLLLLVGAEQVHGLHVAGVGRLTVDRFGGDDR